MYTVGLMLSLTPRKSHFFVLSFMEFKNASNHRVTRDLLSLNDSFRTEQLNLWFHNRTGQASSIPTLFNILKTSFKAYFHAYHDLLV
jgi:hypothetical protein